jgi:secondary thiamine-phosphate synthase enzyme
MFQEELVIETRGRGSFEITADVAALVDGSSITDGLCHLFIRHTSASLMVNENADPVVLEDLETFMRDLVPDGDPRFRHTAEGPDDMPAHIRSLLTQTDLSIPVRGGRLTLGSWQGIFLWEHRTRPHRRTVLVSIQG